MADIVNATSTYSSGTIDTASTLVDNVSPHAAKHVNYPVGAIIQVETILGAGTTLKGSAADLATRLAVGMNATGTLKLSTDAAIDGPLNTTKGGTGLATITDGAVMVGNGTGNVVPVSLPSAPRVLCHSGTAGADPSWLTGLLYHGPTSCGTGSTRSHEGSVTVSADGNYSGIHYYTDFTLNAGKTMTVPTGKRRLIIIATNSITINGTISAVGAGGAGGTASTPGGSGTDQAGGGGSSSGTNGGDVEIHGCGFGVFGTATAGNGNDATQLTGSDLSLVNPLDAMGAAGGGYGTGTGGRGGGSIVLIAPTITLGAAAVLNTSSAGRASNADGQGGGGNVYIQCRSFTDNGCTFTLTGGAASGGAPFGGGAGDGIKQINIYA